VQVFLERFLRKGAIIVCTNIQNPVLITTQGTRPNCANSIAEEKIADMETDAISHMEKDSLEADSSLFCILAFISFKLFKNTQSIDEFNSLILSHVQKIGFHINSFT
jgi:hypothetical protein